MTSRPSVDSVLSAYWHATRDGGSVDFVSFVLDQGWDFEEFECASAAQDEAFRIQCLDPKFMENLYEGFGL